LKEQHGSTIFLLHSLGSWNKQETLQKIKNKLHQLWNPSSKLIDINNALLPLHLENSDANKSKRKNG